MVWTDEYRTSRSGAFEMLDKAYEKAAKNRKGDTRALAIIHLTYRDQDGKRYVIDKQTPLKRSGMAATESSFFSQGDNGPEAADAKKDAEKAVCSDARAVMLGVAEEKQKPYRITIDIITNRRNCNNCLGDIQRLCDDVDNLFPAAEVKINTLASDRQGKAEVFSSVPGRLNRQTGEYRSKYGSFSATPMHLSSTSAAGPSQVEGEPELGDQRKYWKHTVYGGEPTRYEGVIQEPELGGGVVPSISDKSPYTSSNYQTSSGSDSEDSGRSAGKASEQSGGSGESELSARFDAALNPAKWLPEQQFPNTHLGADWQWDASSGVYYAKNFEKIWDGEAQYEFVGVMADVEGRTAYGYRHPDGHLGVYTFDERKNMFDRYPGIDAHQWVNSTLNMRQQGQGSSSQVASSSSGQKKQKQRQR
jgi:hypothetical protein